MTLNFQIGYLPTYLEVYTYQLFRNNEVCAKRNGPTKHFKICYISCIRHFFVFQFVQLLLFPLWMPWFILTYFRALTREKVKLHRMKNKKASWIYSYIKYSKFSSISLEYFVEHKILLLKLAYYQLPALHWIDVFIF